MSTVPELLLCQGCIGFANYKGWIPFNVLLCRKPKHAETRGPYNEVHNQVERYMGKLTPGIDENSLKYAVNFLHQVYSVIPNTVTDQGKPQTEHELNPVIHTQTGQTKGYNEVVIIPEITEHAAYLMQTIKIGNSEILVFFDRGANVNLISGELAETEGLTKSSLKPTRLTVVGGNSIRTQYGQYKFCLGPTNNDEYHEISCQGIENVTGPFKRYDLSDLNREFKNSLDENPGLLPEYSAGGEVKLLLGIRNTYLDPTLIKILPSGVGVYQSPFKDIWGSRIMYAGPHTTFTSGPDDLDSQVNLTVFHMRRMYLENELSSQILPTEIMVDHKEQIKIQPYPISEEEELGEWEETKMIELRILDNEFSVHKTQIPISKIRNLINEDDTTDLVSYRCEECMKCETCKRSLQLIAISVQEAREQQYIESSVKIDLGAKRVVVTFPFLRNPIKFLSEKHKGNSNYKQARTVYLSQCKKPDRDKGGMKLAHDDLVERGFMVKLSDLPENYQKLIQTAEFKHFYPWFIVSKMDSISTPRRIVVDPSMTGLNLILPKGENKLGVILDIMIRNRVKWWIWISDISKLYNQLHLDPAAYPFSLFLYHQSLDPNIDPDVYVMLRAWYGVIQTGGQAGYALDKLAEISAEEFPMAKECLERDRYVDDILSGTDSIEDRDEQINQVQELLSKAGFSLKYVVKSGENPGEKASTDGVTMKILGYKWNMVEDIMHPGISEFNINKKT